MDNENKEFPNGWGDNSEDDDDYGFVDDTDEYDEDSAWGNSSSPFKKSEPVTSPETNNKTNAQSESVTLDTNNEANDDTVHDASVQNVKQPESISSSAPTLNVSPNQGYILQKQKTSPFLIIVIIVLVLAVGTLGGILFMQKNREKTGDISSDVKHESSNESSEYDTEENERSDSIITTSATTVISSATSTVTMSEIKTTETTLPKEEITELTTEKTDTTDAVKQALYEHMNNESKEPVFDPEPTYALFDLNGDGVDELFISYNNAESLGSDLYIYKDGKYIKSFFAYTGAYICLDEHLMRANWYGGGEMTKIYCMVDNELLQKDELSVSYAINEFSHNDHVITESEYNQLLDQYDAMNWIYVPDNSRLVSDLIDISKYTVNINNDANNSNNSNIYSGYKYIENAPPDMTFYDINDTPSGIVTTESTSLNLRQGPGTNYEIILHLQKGERVEVLGTNSEWAYIKWSVWGAQQWIDYYGYVSREFLSVGYN